MSEVDQREANLEGNLLEADEGFSLTLNTLQQEHTVAVNVQSDLQWSGFDQNIFMYWDEYRNT